MFRAGLDTSGLHAEDGLICSYASQEGVGAEAFPVATTLRYTTDIHHRTEGDIDTLSDMFLAHGNTTGAK
jgi:hypothetical protein